MMHTMQCHVHVTRAMPAGPLRWGGLPAIDRAKRVYPCGAESVNRSVARRAARGLGALLCLSMAALAGCVQPQATGPRQAAQSAARDPVVAVWYYLPAGASDGAALSAAVERDFAIMAQLGIDTVLLRLCPPKSLPAVCRAAQRHDLAVVAPDPAATRFVRSGLGRERVLADGEEFPAHPVLTGRLIGAIVNPQTARRAATVVEAARSARTSQTLWAQLGETEAAIELPALDRIVHGPAGSKNPASRGAGPGGLQTVVCKVLRGQEEATSRTWLADYHRGLLRGETGGVVFDSFRTLPGKYQGLVEKNEPIGPERAATVRKIAARAAAWGPVLAGLKPAPLAAPDPGPNLRAGLLVSSSRRCLLVVNESPTQFVHRKWTCPLPLGGSVTRAVAVPTAENMLPGAVHTVGDGGLVIPLDLPPGEAALFELF